MVNSRTKAAQRVDESKVLKRLLLDHFDGAVLVDLDTDEIIPIYDSCTGRMVPYIDSLNTSYSYNMGRVMQNLEKKVQSSVRDKVALDVVRNSLDTQKTYSVRIHFIDDESSSLYKKLCYEYYDDQKDLVILTCEDISETVASETDPLTDLYNSAGFHRRVMEWIENNPEKKFRIQRYDIDHFRNINGVYGYSVGNRVLRDFGRFMKMYNSGDCFAAHLNADHFARFCPEGSPPPEYYSEACHEAFKSYELSIPLTIHMGIYDLCEPGCDSFDMSYKALLALQSAKGKHDRSFVYYQKGTMEAEIEQQELLNDVDRAIRDDEFEVWFQPQINYRTGELLGAEALTRWRHSQKGLLSPVSFIPILENSNRIGEIDKHIIEKACRYIRKWMDMMPDRPIIVSGNLSRSYVHNPDFVQNLRNIVECNDVPIGNIRFEITESAYMDRPEQLIEVVKEMRSEGFVIEMDDFGSAYSSLNMLKDIEIDILKLDMKFLAGENTRRSEIIISSVIRMAKELGLKVIAEGVETRQQADMLLDFGCEIMQGYYFSKPVPADEYEKLLQSPPIFK